VGDCYSHTSIKVTNLTLMRYLFYPYIARKLVVCLVALMVSNLTSKSPPSYRRILVTCCEDSNARCGNIYSSTNVGAFFFFLISFFFLRVNILHVFWGRGRGRGREGRWRWVVLCNFKEMCFVESVSKNGGRGYIFLGSCGVRLPFFFFFNFNY
jgi:hypothetical protein